MIDPVSERYKAALRLGHEAVVKGRPREAIEHYEEAGRLAGHRPLPFLSMGSVFLQMRRPAEAIAAFDEALRRAPGELAALRGKVQALEAAGRREEAAGLARRADELAAMERAGRPGLAAAVEAQEAERPFRSAAEAAAAGQHDAAIDGFLEAAGAFARRDQWAAALDACYRALELAPGELRVHLAMAELYLQRGWAEPGAERLALVEHALDLEPDPGMRRMVADLARDFRALHPVLERLARLEA